MKRSFLIASLFVSLCFIIPPVHAASFTDVSPTHANYSAIEFLKSKNIVKGYTDGTFKPGQQVNRVEALKMIFTAAGITANTPSSSQFADVPLDAWFAPYVMTGKSKNIVNGDGTTGNFAPARAVKKAEFIKMLLLSFDKDVSKHLKKTDVAADVADNAWYTPYMSYAKTVKIIVPNADNKLLPEKILSRAECAEIIYQFLLLERGGDLQKMLNLTESSLISTLLSLKTDDIGKAKEYVNNALTYSKNALNVSPNENIVKAAHEISLAMKDLVDGYEAGLVKDFKKVKIFAESAKTKAGTAYNYSTATQNIGKGIKNHADILLTQIK